MAAAVLYVQNMKLVSTFYQRSFGLSVLDSSEDDDFRVLASADWELTLVVMPAATAATIEITVPPRRREDSPVKLAFDVASIEGLREVITAVGGTLDPIGSAWEFRGRRHLDCLDPEGNVVQLRQPWPAVQPQERTTT